ncbi:MAG: helix-turn-helix domain containing protein [Spirochaetales bacterium]|uniref:Helix-turn-helix domain containing protein n=1 Tax=Candidatus Thalassospirochaeta sargassi TaxID=3119039 RepID=A0AAJ1MJM6_9SPIO|nr:helix-turn-helix domain containing protein [Spirochaetales bacterium]
MNAITHRQRQAIETKLKITRIAINLFKQRGFSDVTVRDICTSASISIGTFYHHFESKEEIVNTSHRQMDRLWEERISNYEGVNTKEDIIFHFAEAGRLIQELGWDLAAASYRQLITSHNKYAVQNDRPISNVMRRIIGDAIASGSLPADTDQEEMIEVLIRCSRGVLFDWCLRNGEYDLPSKIRSDMTLVLNNFF